MITFIPNPKCQCLLWHFQPRKSCAKVVIYVPSLENMNTSILYRTLLVCIPIIIIIPSLLGCALRSGANSQLLRGRWLHPRICINSHYAFNSDYTSASTTGTDLPNFSSVSVSLFGMAMARATSPIRSSPAITSVLMVM